MKLYRMCFHTKSVRYVLIYLLKRSMANPLHADLWNSKTQILTLQNVHLILGLLLLGSILYSRSSGSYRVKLSFTLAPVRNSWTRCEPEDLEYIIDTSSKSPRLRCTFCKVNISHLSSKF